MSPSALWKWKLKTTKNTKKKTMKRCVMAAWCGALQLLVIPSMLSSVHSFNQTEAQISFALAKKKMANWKFSPAVVQQSDHNSIQINKSRLLTLPIPHWEEVRIFHSYNQKGNSTFNLNSSLQLRCCGSMHTKKTQHAQIRFKYQTNEIESVIVKTAARSNTKSCY